MTVKTAEEVVQGILDNPDEDFQLHVDEITAFAEERVKEATKGFYPRWEVDAEKRDARAEGHADGRLAGLEEAAKICDAHRKRTRREDPYQEGEHDMADIISEEIRALKEIP